jgi:hypothetical protein
LVQVGIGLFVTTSGVPLAFNGIDSTGKHPFDLCAITPKGTRASNITSAIRISQQSLTLEAFTHNLSCEITNSLAPI